MLCKKCGKEIHNDIRCPYCRCENYYHHEDIPEHLKYVDMLMSNQFVNLDADDSNTVHDGKGDVIDEEDSDEIYDEEMDEMMRKKYSVLKGIVTASICVLCLFVGFIAGGYTERELFGEKNENRTKAEYSDNNKESETAKTVLVTENETEAHMPPVTETEEDFQPDIQSPFLVIEGDTGDYYMTIELPVGKRDYIYDYSEIEEQIDSIQANGRGNLNIFLSKEEDSSFSYPYIDASGSIYKFVLKIPVKVNNTKNNTDENETEFDDIENDDVASMPDTMAESTENNWGNTQIPDSDISRE
ncbi:MAG: hypothetical protein MRZ59_07825 [Clostridiales bacterium]|nr:hypothetical protein [Clostridiales bacterium]MDY3745449.1 hypothetical protein [Lachnospiraceae bacterium]